MGRRGGGRGGGGGGRRGAGGSGGGGGGGGRGAAAAGRRGAESSRPRNSSTSRRACAARRFAARAEAAVAAEKGCGWRRRGSKCGGSTPPVARVRADGTPAVMISPRGSDKRGMTAAAALATGAASTSSTVCKKGTLCGSLRLSLSSRSCSRSCSSSSLLKAKGEREPSDACSSWPRPRACLGPNPLRCRDDCAAALVLAGCLCCCASSS